jgi:4a-hydroxytetrahydrobiopterin dehydratase
VQHVQVAIDALDIARARPFWCAVLGYPFADEAVLRDAHREGQTFWFQQMDSPKVGRNRFHIVIYLMPIRCRPESTPRSRPAARGVSDAHAPLRWTFADPEGSRPGGLGVGNRNDPTATPAEPAAWSSRIPGPVSCPPGGRSRGLP